MTQLPDKNQISIPQSFRAALGLLSSDQKKQFFSLAIFSVFASVIDIGGLLVVFKAISVVLSPDSLYNLPIIGGLLLQYGFEIPDFNLVLLFVLVLGVIIIRNLVSTGLLYFQARFAAIVAGHLVVNGLRYYLFQGITKLRLQNSGSLVRNVVVNPVQFSRFVLNSQMIILSELIIVVFIILALMWYDPVVLAILAVVLVPISAVFYRTIRQRVTTYGIQKDKVLKGAQHVTLEGLDGYVDLFVYNKRGTYINELKGLMRSLIPVETKMTVIQQLGGKVMEVIAFLGLLILLCYALFYADNKEYFLSLMTVFVLLVYRTMPTYNRIMNSMLLIKNNSHLFEIVRKKNENHSEIILDGSGSINFNDSIEFIGVSYKYPNAQNNAISNVSLKINAGEIIGFIGSSGSGKTTLINILLRLLQEDEGVISVDGITLDQSNSLMWLSMIGYVQQDVFIQEMSVARNIAFCEDETQIDRERVLDALIKANLVDFVEGLESGIDEVIRERGRNLSGGQKQRLAIARALYKNSKLLIFDEATSALDVDSETELSKTIEHLRTEGCTVIIIAHRYSSLKTCDKIIEIGNGEILRTVEYSDL